MDRIYEEVDIGSLIEQNKELLVREGGILLDIGCGEDKRRGFVGLDKRPIEGVVA